LLNHLTSPNCVIWSAIIASAAVPGILNPVVLIAKDRNGQVQPHNLGGSRFKDGSLREDIPLGSLHTQFNCNFSIVSQTNPHIHLFFFAPRGSVGRPVAHRKGKGWRGGFILSALESYIKLDLSKHFKVIRDLDLLPQILQSDWSGVFLQRFSGDLTLTPRSTVGDWWRLLSDPNQQQLRRMLEVGEKVTWPALRMVSNRLTIEVSLTVLAFINRKMLMRSSEQSFEDVPRSDQHYTENAPRTTSILHLGCQTAPPPAPAITSQSNQMPMQASLVAHAKHEDHGDLACQEQRCLPRPPLQTFDDEEASPGRERRLAIFYLQYHHRRDLAMSPKAHTLPLSTTHCGMFERRLHQLSHLFDR